MPVPLLTPAREVIHHHLPHHHLRMATKKYITSILLYLSLLIGEVHTLFENTGNSLINWIWFRSVPMTLQYNVKYATNQLWYIFVFVAMLYYTPNRINKTTVRAFVFYSVIDTLFYFINYKTFEYSIVYFLVLWYWIIDYNLFYDRGTSYKLFDADGYVSDGNNHVHLLKR
jgi:hypothetical protein